MRARRRSSPSCRSSGSGGWLREGAVRPPRRRAMIVAIDTRIRVHEYCGELDAGARARSRVWMTCTCGAVLVRVLAFG
jgi:hypothetical protein